MVFIVVKFFEVNIFTVIVFSNGIIFLSRNARKCRGCAGVPSGFFLTEIIFSHKFHELSQIIIFYLPQITQIFIAMRCVFFPQFHELSQNIIFLYPIYFYCLADANLLNLAG